MRNRNFVERCQIIHCPENWIEELKLWADGPRTANEIGRIELVLEVVGEMVLAGAKHRIPGHVLCWVEGIPMPLLDHATDNLPADPHRAHCALEGIAVAMGEP